MPFTQKTLQILRQIHRTNEEPTEIFAAAATREPADIVEEDKATGDS